MNEIINQFSNIDSLGFDDAKNALAYAGIAVLPLTVAAFGIDYNRNPKSNLEGIKGAEADALVVASEVREGRLISRTKKWAPFILLATGISLASIDALDPYIERDTTLPNSEVALVIDGSTSMQKTVDMTDSTSRLASGVEIANSLSEFYPNEVKSGTIVFGLNAEVIEPLTNTRNMITEEQVKDLVDPSGGSVQEAVALANNILIGSESEGINTLVVISDGTVDAIENASEDIKNIASDGTEVIFAFTGTRDGSYNLTNFDNQATASGIQIDEFGLSDIENIKVIESSDSTMIQNQIRDQINESITRTEKSPTDIFWYGGLIAIGAGMLAYAGKLLRRKY